MLGQEPVYSHQNISRLTDDLCPPNVRHTACWWQINTPGIWVPSFSFLFIFLPPFLTIYIHLSLPNSQNLWTRQALWLAADPSPPSPAHHLADGAVPQWRKMRSCRGLALCAQISSPQCPQSVFHQNKAILNFYCINWILKGIDQPKMEILSAFTHPYVVPTSMTFLYCGTPKKLFWKTM